MSDTDLQVISTQTPDQFMANHNQLITFVKSQLKAAKTYKDDRGNDKMTEGDYGVIPRTSKKSLLKPGAEKLLKLFGLSAKMELVSSNEDFKNNFISYRYKCTITHIASDKFIADATRSCNNKEVKHARKDVYDVANTIEAVAQKRALIAATVQATMATEIFDADVSEHETEGPGEKTTREDDPRRNRITMGLYGTANRYGWNDNHIHAALKKKWDYDSVTQASNQDLEELKEFIELNYKEVEKGEKPVLIKKEVINLQPEKPEEIKENMVDVEIIEDTKYTCKGTKHHPANEKLGLEDTMVYTTFENPWCSKECEEEYYPKKKDSVDRPWEKWVK